MGCAAPPGLEDQLCPPVPVFRLAGPLFCLDRECFLRLVGGIPTNRPVRGPGGTRTPTGMVGPSAYLEQQGRRREGGGLGAIERAERSFGEFVTNPEIGVSFDEFGGPGGPGGAN